MKNDKTFKALSDPIRREILYILRRKKMSAGEIVDRFDLSGATISYHLKLLKQANLITEEKDKNYIYYSLNISALDSSIKWLLNLQNQYNKKAN